MKDGFEAKTILAYPLAEAKRRWVTKNIKFIAVPFMGLLDKKVKKALASIELTP